MVKCLECKSWKSTIKIAGGDKDLVGVKGKCKIHNWYCIYSDSCSEGKLKND